MTSAGRINIYALQCLSWFAGCCSLIPAARWARGQFQRQGPPPSSQSYVYYIDALHGNDSNDGSISSPWRTIGYAESVVSAGTTVIVKPGNYGNLSIDNSGGEETPIVFISEIKNAAQLGTVTISADHIVLQDFDIESENDNAGVLLSSSNNITITGNYIHHCGGGGIRTIPDTANITIDHNVLYRNAGVGINLSGSDALIEDNQILGMVSYLPGKSIHGGDGDGFLLQGNNHVIRSNTIADMVDPEATEFFLEGHTPHIDCFQVNTVYNASVDYEPLTNTVIEGNHCWSNNFNRAFLLETYVGGRTSHDIIIRENVFEFLGTGLIIRDREEGYEMSGDERNQPYYNIQVENNVFKSRTKIDTTAERVAIRLLGVHNYSVVNNITIDCDNHTHPDYSGQDIDIAGGTGTHDYNVAWSSTGALFTGPASGHEAPGPHSRNDIDPLLMSYTEALQGGNDYRLQAVSPLIDTGGLSAAGSNFSRYLENGPDAGVHEFDVSSGGHSRIDIAVTLGSACTPADISFTIPLWKDNKDAAVMFDFDDGTEGQRNLGLPLFAEKGLKATWFINPGTARFIDYEPVWHAYADTQEFANHTMSHGDNYTTLEQWDAEVLGAARAVWKLRGECGNGTNTACSEMGLCDGGQCLDTSQGTTLGLPLYNGNANVPIVPNIGGSFMSVCVSDSNSVTWGDWRDVDLLYQFSYNNIDQTSAVYNQDNPAATVRGVTCTVNNMEFSAQNGFMCGGESALTYLETAINNPVNTTAQKFLRLRAHDIVNGDATSSAVSREELNTFLDILSDPDVAGSVAGRVWSAGTAEMYKYASESLNSTVSPVQGQQCADRSYFEVTINDGAMNYRTDGATRLYQRIKGATVSQGSNSGDLLFNEPITIMLSGTGWQNGQVCETVQETQAGNISRNCYIRDGIAYVEAVPDMGKVLAVVK